MIFADYPGHFVALVLALAAAVVLFAAFSAGALRTPQRSRYRWLLAAMHYFAVLLVLMILWDPSAWRKKETFGRNTVLAVFDTSESMSVADEDGRSRLDKSVTRFAECLDSRGEEGPEYRVYGFDERAYHCGSADLLRRWGVRSNLHEAISLVADSVAQDEQRAMQGEPAGVVVFTDGRVDDRDPRHYLPAMREDLPVLVVGVGARTPRPDLSVETIVSPAVAWVDTAYDVAVAVTAANVPNAPTMLELLCDNEVVETHQLNRDQFRPGVSGASQAVAEFTVPAQQLGPHVLTARVKACRGEINTANNARSASVEVTQERSLRVLLYTQWANFDVGKIRQALARDKHIRLDFGFDVIKDKPLSSRASQATGYVTLADLKTKLNEYDVLVEGPSYIGFEGSDLSDFFLKRGGGMILLPGKIVETLATDGQGRGDGSLPVLFAQRGPSVPIRRMPGLDVLGTQERAVPTTVERFWPPRPGAIKLSFESQIARVFDPAVFADSQWRVSPYYGIAEVKPAATTLASVGDTPIVTVHRVGRGRVCLLNASKLFTLYREDRKGGALSELMSGLVAYMGRTPAQGAGIDLFAERAAGGSGRVEFNAYVVDKDFEPVAAANVLLTAGERVVSMEPTGRGYYRATLDWGPAQSVVAKVQAEFNGSFLGERTLAANLPPVRDEMSCVDMDEPFLQALAERIRAKYIHVDDLDEDAGKLFVPRRQVGVEEVVTSVWPRWWLLATLCLLLSAGWFIRRAIGLV